MIHGIDQEQLETWFSRLLAIDLLALNDLTRACYYDFSACLLSGSRGTRAWGQKPGERSGLDDRARTQLVEYLHLGGALSARLDCQGIQDRAR